MAKRKQTATAQVGLRIREPLRAEMEKAAKKRGVSLNSEMAGRLEQSLKQEEEFGGPEMLMMARLMAAAFLRGGQAGSWARGHPEWTPAEWMEDPSCYPAACYAVADALRAAQPVQLKFGEDVPAESRALSNKVNEAFAQLIARGYDIKVTKEGE